MQTHDFTASARLYIGNIAHEETEATVAALFSARGIRYEHVSLVVDRSTGHSRGFAFVEFAAASDAEAARKRLDGALIGGRPVDVQSVEERRASRHG